MSPPHWLSTSPSACPDSTVKHRHVQDQSLRLAPAAAARRAHDAAPRRRHRARRPRPMLSTPIFTCGCNAACAHCTAPPHPTGRRRMRIFCAPARCRRPHASRTTFSPPASAPSLPSRPPVCRVCWSHGAASRRRLQPRAAPSGLERAAAFASPSLGECRAFSARLRLRRYGLPTASFWRSQQLTAPGTRAERAHHSRGGSGGRARSVSPQVVQYPAVRSLGARSVFLVHVVKELHDAFDTAQGTGR